MVNIAVAVVIFVISQFVLKLIIEPLIKFRQILDELSFQILYHQSSIVSGVSAEPEVSNQLKELSAKLRSSVSSIVLYSFIQKVLFFLSLPSKKEVFESCRDLNLISSKLKKLRRDPITYQENLQNIGDKLNIEISYS